jgi:hypothetical protein
VLEETDQQKILTSEEDLQREFGATYVENHQLMLSHSRS